MVAREFLAWLGVPAGKRWLDVGCGTGALTQSILRERAPSQVHGVDPSAGFVEYARAHTADARAGFEVGDAQALPAGGFDAAAAGLVLNFVPKPERAALRERIRARLPFRADGSLALVARAWAAKGVVPTSSR